MSGLNRKLLLTLFAASALGAGPAHAANDAMLELLKVLKEKGTIDEAAYEALKSAAQADDEQNTAGQTEVKQAAQTLPKIETKGKLEITTPDGDFSWRLGGRVHIDGTFANDDRGTLNTTAIDNKADVRRARLDLTATAWRTWQFKVQYDFADGSDRGVNRGLRDAWIKYLHKGSTPGVVTVGHFKEFIGLEEITSSNDISFVERSMLSGAFNAANGRRLGVGASVAFADMVTTSLGVFGREIGNSNDDAVKLTGRVTVSPIHSADKVVHVGAAGSWITDYDNDAFAANPRPEFDASSSARLLNTSISDVEDAYRFGGEAAVVWGPFSVQGEYQRIDLNRTPLSTEKDPSFDGWYLFASWMLTGESRLYKFEDGIFQNPKPAGIVGKGGWGAWEVLARYSNVDLLDGTVGSGDEDNVTVGLNWYPTPNTKFMANYIHVLDIKGGDFDAAEPSAVALRAQAYW